MMIELSLMIIAQTIGLLLWSSILNAPMLQWRARKIRNWYIKYKQAYIVSIKAGFVAIVTGDVAILSLAFSGNTNESLIKFVGFVFGIISWWFTHSNALLKIADNTGAITVRDARSISTSVIGYLIGGLFVLGILVVAIASMVLSIK